MVAVLIVVVVVAVAVVVGVVANAAVYIRKRHGESQG